MTAALHPVGQRDIEAFEERAAIMEHDGGLTVDEAETAARANFRIVTALDLALIKADGSTQSRASIDKSAVAEYVEALQGGADLSAVEVFHDGADYWLADGFHRVAAYSACGRTTIPANIHEGTLRDAILHAVGANATHGLRRTNDDKRRAVSILLADPEWSRWSDNAIAKRCNVSQPFVSKLRDSHLQTFDDDGTRKVLRGGTIYDQDTSCIGKREALPVDAEKEGANVSSPKSPKPPKAGGASAPVPAEPRAPAPAPPTGPTADEIGAAAHGDGTLEDILEDTRAELDAARRSIAALTAGDKEKELLKWQTLADMTARRADEHLAKINQRDRHLKWMGSILKKISKIVGEDEYAKLPARIKVLVDSAAVVS